MCLEGECTNRHCKAHKKKVIMNWGYSEFDFINEAYTCKCPMCDEPVDPSTCGFNNCQWKFITRKVNPGKPPQTETSKWTSVGDKYARYSPEKKRYSPFC